MTDIINILLDIKKLLEILVDKSYSRSNIHSIYTFNTAGTNKLNKDISQMLGLPKQYTANEMIIFDKGGGFTFKINGQNPPITAANNLSISQEDINNFEIIPAGIAGTAYIRFSAYIPKVK